MNGALGDELREEGGTLWIRSLGALREARSKLAAFKDGVEARARAARQAIDILERIRDEERSSIGDLFDPDGPATRTFRRITKGAYTQVLVKGDEPTVSVRRADGELIPLEKLSRGATDQLYLSVRITLAKKLLGDEPGFFVMDDPFLTSDMGRLREQVSILKELAEDGWQIVYFTSKGEVVKTFEERVGIEPVELDILPGLKPPGQTSDVTP